MRTCVLEKGDIVGNDTMRCTCDLEIPRFRWSPVEVLDANECWCFAGNFPNQNGGLVMKRKQHSVEQIVDALRQAELGVSVADLVRRLGISEQTYYRWKKQYAELESNHVREMKQLHELKQLQDENERLKKMIAELSVEKAVL